MSGTIIINKLVGNGVILENKGQIQNSFVSANSKYGKNTVSYAKSKKIKHNDIVLKINRYGRDIEAHPSLYANKNEEALRDLFLTYLNSSVEEFSTTGETFNKKGKTDIFIQGGSIDKITFIAECKIWKGNKYFLKAIDQLLSYLTWRNTNAAIIVFVRNKELTRIIEDIKGIVKKHLQYFSERKHTSESSLSYFFKLPQDSKRKIRLDIILFHFDE